MNSRDKFALHRFQYIEKIKNRPKDMSVIDACKGAGVSFPTYYKWLRRFTSAKNTVDSLYDRRPTGERHYKRLRPEQKNAIIEVIIKHPEYGSQRISNTLPKKEDGKSLVSNGGVQNFLERRGLNLIKNRIKFAEEYLKAVKKENDKKIETVIFNRNQEEEVVLSGVVNL
ncbi:MAG: helix-turn-helix domain-containing protein [Nitrospirae bacterium]|nr:helix-turn-helix domain-containing protein [Nitrospirota bacterium]